MFVCVVDKICNTVKVVKFLYFRINTGEKERDRTHKMNLFIAIFTVLFAYEPQSSKPKP